VFRIGRRFAELACARDGGSLVGVAPRFPSNSLGLGVSFHPSQAIPTRRAAAAYRLSQKSASLSYPQWHIAASPRRWHRGYGLGVLSAGSLSSHVHDKAQRAPVVIPRRMGGVVSGHTRNWLAATACSCITLLMWPRGFDEPSSRVGGMQANATPTILQHASYCSHSLCGNGSNDRCGPAENRPGGLDERHAQRTHTGLWEGAIACRMSTFTLVGPGHNLPAAAFVGVRTAEGSLLPALHHPSRSGAFLPATIPLIWTFREPPHLCPSTWAACLLRNRGQRDHARSPSRAMGPHVIMFSTDSDHIRPHLAPLIVRLWC